MQGSVRRDINQRIFLDAQSSGGINGANICF
jgi:hypothetical protein